MNFILSTTDNSQFRPPCVSDTVILLSHEQAEVFNTVLRVRIVSQGKAMIIEHGQEGCSTHSFRPLEKVYNVIYNRTQQP